MVRFGSADTPETKAPAWQQWQNEPVAMLVGRLIQRGPYNGAICDDPLTDAVTRRAKEDPDAVVRAIEAGALRMGYWPRIAEEIGADRYLALAARMLQSKDPEQRCDAINAYESMFDSDVIPAIAMVCRHVESQLGEPDKETDPHVLRCTVIALMTGFQELEKRLEAAKGGR